MKPTVFPTGKAPSQRPAPARLSVKAFIGQTIPSSQAAALRGGDGDDTSALYPWIDKP
jgi:hypothetical protein